MDQGVGGKAATGGLGRLLGGNHQDGPAQQLSRGGAWHCFQWDSDGLAKKAICSQAAWAKVGVGCPTGISVGWATPGAMGPAVAHTLGGHGN